MNDTYDYGKRNKLHRTVSKGLAHEIETPVSNSELFGTSGPVISKRQEANDTRVLQPSITEVQELLGRVTMFDEFSINYIASSKDVENVPEC